VENQAFMILLEIPTEIPVLDLYRLLLLLALCQRIPQLSMAILNVPARTPIPYQLARLCNL
jgi:hypothetical protein